MMHKKAFLSWCCVAVLTLAGCSRQQSDWQKTRESNTAEAYEQFLKKYPTGEFAAQAQARVKELYEERDWQKARDADTPEAYQAFLKQYPEGKWMEEARIRIENFTLAQAPTGSAAPSADAAATGAAEGAAVAGAPAAVVPAAGGAASGAVSDKTRNPPSAPTVPPHKPTAAVPARAASTPAAHASAAAKPAGHSAKRMAVAGGSGRYGVQLGAFKSGPAAATQRWEHLQKQYPKLLAGLATKVVPKKSGAGHLYRLQAVGLTESHARALCKSLKAKSQACVVVKVAPG